MQTVTVQRANIVLQVESDNVDKYLANGYNVLDENGNIVKRAMPQTIKDYQDVIKDLQQKLELAYKEIEVLKKTPFKSEPVIKEKPATEKRSKKTAKAE